MLALLFGFAPMFVNASTSPDVVISEVAWAGSSTSSADEWLELANVSNHAVDVSGWNLAGASSSPIIFPTGSLIESHSTFLIANYANTSTSSTLNTHAQIVTTLVSIPNDKLAITLTSSTGSVVDSAGSGGTPFAGASGGTGSTTDGRFRSMERRDVLIDGKTKDAWTNADTTSGFKDGATDYGTPGSFNPNLLAQLITFQPAPTTSPATNPVAAVVIDPVTTDPLITQTSSPIDPTEPEKICEDVVTDATTTSTNTISPPDPVTPIPEPEVLSTPVTVPAVTSETSTSTSLNQPVPITVEQTPQGTLHVSEIFPHPAANESEWVELENTSAYPVVTNGWTILDASNAATPLPDGIVSPGAFLTIENPKGKLNNDGDSVVVKDANGSVVDSVVYNADFGTVPNTDESLVRVNTTTLTITTTPTKNSSNILTPRVTSSAPTSTTSTSFSNNTETTSVTPVATNTTPPVSTIPEAPAASPVSVTPSPKTLRLSEFYPNTGGNDLTDEFIEIENTGNQSVSLNGWSIKDASGTKFTFANDALIGAHTYKAFLHPETKISLNNSGDTITLTAPDGSIIDTQTYDQAKTGVTYARSENIWDWTTTRTPNEPNVVSGNSDPIPTATPPEPTTSTNTSSPTQSNGANTTSLLTIEEAKQRTDGTRVKIHGTVTALPNTFNSQTMYVQDETGGIQIFKSDCLFPALVEGQSITVTGVLSHVNSEARIKVTNQTSLLVGSLVEAVSPTTITSADTSSVGSLITIAGRVMSRLGNRLALNVNGETMNVDLPKISTAVYRTGSTVQVSGILSKTKSGTVVKARSEQDVTQLPKEDGVQATPNITAVGAQEPKQTMAIVLILLASLAFIGLKLRPRLYALTQSYGRKTPLRPRS